VACGCDNIWSGAHNIIRIARKTRSRRAAWAKEIVRKLMLSGEICLLIKPFRSVADEVAFRKIYNTAAPFIKSSYYEPYRLPGVRDVFTERNENMHGKLRRPIATTFSSEGIKDLDGNIDKILKKFISQMELFQGRDVDLGQWFERLLFGELILSRFSF
jgi:hypothetical protein